jgi:hypothetical protein
VLVELRCATRHASRCSRELNGLAGHENGITATGVLKRHHHVASVHMRIVEDVGDSVDRADWHDVAEDSQDLGPGTARCPGGENRVELLAVLRP